MRLDGDPTEGALLTAARKAGFTEQFIEAGFHVIEEFPFDSERKMMSVVVETNQKKSGMSLQKVRRMY
ncbi:hypothetical protein BsIDN1_28370 [Bacillus safensis]|uniref:Uncharacterized protein n=1 Tax=Bacillus safensis TaxID=561879 RepID=A0A5S9MB91_BACIA|nr:hypothetical protein BsIDN1_28370 [Bacillus safensis]